jgi:hypothetical protein
MTFAQKLEGLLWPERFPPGHDRHDPEHVFWDGCDVGADRFGEFYEWSADTIEWVAALVTQEREREETP